MPPERRADPAQAPPVANSRLGTQSGREETGRSEGPLTLGSGVEMDTTCYSSSGMSGLLGTNERMRWR